MVEFSLINILIVLISWLYIIVSCYDENPIEKAFNLFPVLIENFYRIEAFASPLKGRQWLNPLEIII